MQNRTELDQFYANWSHALPSLIAQEVIPGPDTYSWVCSSAFNCRQELLGCAIKQKLRMYPVHYGVSCFAVSRRNSDLVDIVQDIGRKLKCVGQTHLEFRWDDRDRLYKYIEINPRIPGNVGFDEDSGIPTAWSSYQVALDPTYSEKHLELVEGVHFLDWEQDLYSQLHSGTPKLVILKTLVSHLFRNTKGPYFAWDDPMPGFDSAFRFSKTAIRSIIRKIGSKRLHNERAHSVSSGPVAS